MRLSAASYYSDYILYPTLATTLTAASLATTPVEKWGVWTLSLAAGVATWTFAEYQLHRWVLHHVPYVKDMHEAHHDDQKALIGTPPWLSLALMLILVLLPAILLVGFSYGAGFTAGIVAGYFFYIIVHHGVHHWRLQPGSYLYKLKHRHALHHHFNDAGNFGVTTGFWDKAFGTDIKVDRSGRRA
jgi:sterol desaturase/sphingolipid hydroxylase (fatty acid hydroxylase superfamily)